MLFFTFGTLKVMQLSLADINDGSLMFLDMFDGF